MSTSNQAASDLELLQQKLRYVFKDQSLLQMALLHRSAGTNHNERLEFLGDAVFDLVVSLILYHHYPDSPEGVLSRMRARLVREESLAAMARALELGDYLTLGPGEVRNGGSERDSILADAMEAVVGAIFLDGGYGAVECTIAELTSEMRNQDLSEVELKDPKTRLQEWLQGRGLPLPHYEILEERGEPHQRSYRVSCKVEGLQATEAEALGRRRAEQAAAEQVLRLLGSLMDDDVPSSMDVASKGPVS